MDTPMFCEALRIIRCRAGHTFRDVATLAEVDPLDVQAMEEGRLPPTQPVVNAYAELAKRR